MGWKNEARLDTAVRKKWRLSWVGFLNLEICVCSEKEGEDEWPILD